MTLRIHFSISRLCNALIITLSLALIVNLSMLISIYRNIKIANNEDIVTPRHYIDAYTPISYTYPESPKSKLLLIGVFSTAKRYHRRTLLRSM